MGPHVFASLAHELRLKVFQLLMAELPGGLPAGQIALRLQVPSSTLSTHLAQLERAGLLRSWREQQRIVYAVDSAGTRKLVGFLVNDCCGGQPDICGFRAESAPKRAQRGKG